MVPERVILDAASQDDYSPWCVILTLKDSRIVLDHTDLAPARWPGIEVAMGLVKLGGLGIP